jgi:hypothetical protein
MLTAARFACRLQRVAVALGGVEVEGAERGGERASDAEAAEPGQNLGRFHAAVGGGVAAEEHAAVDHRIASAGDGIGTRGSLTAPSSTRVCTGRPNSAAS